MASQSIRDFMERSPHAFNENVEHQILLYEIVQQLQTADRFFDVLPEVEEKLKALVHAEHVVVFKRGRHQRELSTRVDIDDICREFHVRFNPRSIAGFVAMTGNRICVQDTTDAGALHAIHENLKPVSELENLVDMKSTLAVPIRHGDTLIGVFQLINRTDGNFTKSELARVEVLADMLGEHFYEELGVTGGPFEQLVVERQISTEELEKANDEAERSGRSVAWVLKEDHGVSREHILESMSSYYQIPFASATLNASVPAKLVEQINQNYFMNEGWLPVAEDGRDITIVIADPNDSEKVMSIERLFPGKQIQLKLMILEEVHRLIDSALSADYGAETSIDELTSRATRSSTTRRSRRYRIDRYKKVP
ncbi:MAG: GAF domain-containing protein [Gammaproteobacteria bacterium]|nr:GAF domain-containing protein [Gammaproteobacteria bacterium]